MKHLRLLLLSVAVFLLGGFLLLGAGPMPTSADSTTATANTGVRKLGDINNDGQINTTDARLALQYAVDKIGMSEEEWIAGDVNLDEKVNTTDARLILQYAVGKIHDFQNPNGTTTESRTTTEPTRKTTQPAPSETVPLTEATKAVINDDPNTFCNPVNIAYQYQNDYYSREGADPAAIEFQGDYYLFVSHNSGYWWSSDLTNWNFVYCTMPEINKFAPAVCVVGDTMYLTHSNEGSIYKSTDPKSGKWEYVSHPVDWGDPALFTDDDGRVFCYYGCTNNLPLYVVELDPNNNMALLDGPKECFNSNTWAHGFEVGGDNNDNPNSECWLEGAWMTKYDGKYYLQYAVPGTQYAAYADGCYIADDPMGPFTYCENSPISYKATGFMVGAGHGSLMQDLYGNWWKFDTVTISVNNIFERRVMMVPAAFDEHGQLVTNTVFGDYPLYVATLNETPYETPGPDWHLVSYDADASASSELDAKHSAGNAADESMRSWWSAKTGDAGEWLQLDLGKLCSVSALQVNFADQDVQNIKDRSHSFCYNYIVEFSQDGETWYSLVDHTGYEGAPNTATDTSHDYYELVSPIGVRYVRITNKGAIPAGGKFAVSGLRLFGNGGGEAPAKPTGVSVNRPMSDERSAVITWNAVEGAEGYIVRYGSQEDSLNIHHQVIGGNTVTIHNLNMGVDYWFTVDSYNDSGYTKGTELLKAVHTLPAPERPDPNKPSDLIEEGFDVYEAENASSMSGAVVSESGEDAFASGGKTLHNMHVAGAYFEITGVDGGEGGEGTIRLAFSNGNPSAKTQVLVNGKSIGTFDLKNSGGWNSFIVVEIPVSDLLAGKNNTIRFMGGQEGYNPDFVQVVW